MLDYALYYIKSGKSIIPVSPDKKPYIQWLEYTKRIATEDEVRNWWNLYPYANIAIVTGAISGITVVDIESGGISSYLPETLTIETGGGGVHLYYKYTPKFKNAVRLKDLTDIRNDNGYVIAPPSIHKSGNSYKVSKKIEPVDFPAHLFLSEEISEKSKALKYEKWNNILNGISEGGRNDAAAKVCGLFLTKVEYSLWEQIAWPAVKEWNMKNTPPLSESELRATYDSIAKRVSYQQEDTEREIKNMEDLTSEYYNDLANPKQRIGIKSGFGGIDICLNGGFKKGDLIIVGARPSVGKTSFALTLALNAAYEGKKVLFFSVEMNSIDVYHRLLSFVSNVSCNEIIDGSIDKEILKQSATRIKSLPLSIAELTKSTSIEVIEVVKEHLLENAIDLIIVDYLQFLRDKSDSSNESVRVGQITKNLKSLARITNLPVIVPCQLSRKPESRVDRKPVLSDLRESGDIEQDADVVFLLQRDILTEGEKGKAKIILAKNRKGSTAEFDYQFNTRTTMFVDQNKNQYIN